MLATESIKLQQKFSFEAKSAFERLLTQTLWDAHPASFYHSATQEIIALTKYYLRKSQQSDSPSHHISLAWKVKGSNVIDYNEEAVQTDADKITVCEYDNGPWNLSIKLQMGTARLEHKHRKICEQFLSNFISDIYELFGAYLGIKQADDAGFAYSAHIGFEGFAGSIDKITKAINSLFKKLTGESISSRIMLYHAKKPDEGISNGFLFYVSYDIPPGKNDFDDGDDAKAVFTVLQNLYIEKQHAQSNNSAKDDAILASKLTPIATYFSERYRCIANKELKDFEVLKSELLVHPASFLTDKLRGLKSCCKLPLCYQPKGMGPAGRVAKSGITYISQFPGKEKDLDIINVLSTKPYALMRIIEGGFEVGPDKRGVVTPLYGKGQLIGVLYATKYANTTNFITSTEIEIFESLAHRAGDILQEIRDYEFYKNLILAKHQAENDKNNNDAKHILLAVVEEMQRKMRFVMNVYDVAFEQPANCDKDGYSKTLERKVTRVTLELRDSVNKMIKLFLPALEVQVIYVINMSLDLDDLHIFETHREKLELFFSYCWGITGYIAPEQTMSEHEIIHPETDPK